MKYFFQRILEIDSTNLFTVRQNDVWIANKHNDQYKINKVANYNSNWKNHSI